MKDNEPKAGEVMIMDAQSIPGHGTFPIYVKVLAHVRFSDEWQVSPIGCADSTTLYLKSSDLRRN